MKAKYIILVVYIITLFTLVACKDDFLEIKPLSNITPESYFTNDGQLAAYAINMYGVFPISQHGMFGHDVNTDNFASVAYSNIYVPGLWKVGQSGGSWDFSDIAKCNYFFDRVLPAWKAGEIGGGNVEHYIGEMYFLRAYVYFNKLQALGDFPIIRNILPDDKDILTQASKRSPRNEVARFIISDLDSAITLMKSVSPDGKKNRLSKSCAQLLKSRVALYEGSWLKNFHGTAFVPNGPNWPGKSKDYNANYNYPSGSIDSEISYFFELTMEASKAVADAVPLEINNMTAQTEQTNQEFAEAKMVNPYAAMFSEKDMSGYNEVLLWKKYDLGLDIRNSVSMYTQKGNFAGGFTRGMVDGFLMKNGLPIYDPNSGYAGDDYISDVRKNRDGRLWMFLKEPGQLNILIDSPLGTQQNPVEDYPPITNNTESEGYLTGYTSGKGLNYNAEHARVLYGFQGVYVFRAAEAYLNYIEACFEKNGNLDGTAQQYWQEIRIRAGVDPNYQKTIDATIMSEEAKNDWGAYTAGNLIDATLYNIRRERRCELMDDGLRNMDLKRWRAMDQMVNVPYHIEGFKLWGPMKDWYDPAILKYSIGNQSTVSDPARSEYLRPYEKTNTSLVFDGYRWALAHYLDPVALQHFLITSEGNDVATSPIYQNPGWPTEANVGPTM